MHQENSDHALRQTQTLERRPSTSATHIRHDLHFEYGDVRQLDLIFLTLAHCRRRAEVPLLAHYLSKRAPAIGRPAQDELLRARDLFLFKNQPYLFQPLRLVKNEPNGLLSRFCGTPALRLS